VLAQISAAINQPLELDAVVQAAVRELTRALHISQTGLALFDATRQHLIIVADVPASGNSPVSGVEIPVVGNASMQHILTTPHLAIEERSMIPDCRASTILRQRRLADFAVDRGRGHRHVWSDAVDEPHHSAGRH
jgi:hypothetical protein